MEPAGFLLIDQLFRPVYANPECIRILGYPNSTAAPGALDGIMTQKILSFLPGGFDPAQLPLTTQFQSGKRRYSCRVFLLEGHWDCGTEKRIALLMERGLPGPPGDRKLRKFAGLCEDPFGFSPDSRFFHFSRAHQEVYSSLRAMIRQDRGIGVLLGQAGMGKSALLDYLAESLRGESDLALLPGSFESRPEFLRGVLGLLGVSGMRCQDAENLELLRIWLQSKKSHGRRTTLICDEAQDLNFETIENLCLLADLEEGGQKLIQTVLSGRQGLLEKLTDRRLDGLSQKIHVFCRLTPLDETEVRSYVLHRLRIAGCTRQVFSSEALSCIALYSRGIPLNINMLCRHSLSLAATINLQLVDERIVADSAYDLVLRAQPASFWDAPPEPQRPAALRDRRGLRLVKAEDSTTQ